MKHALSIVLIGLTLLSSAWGSRLSPVASGTTTITTGVVSGSQIPLLGTASSNITLTGTIVGAPATFSVQIETSTNNGSSYSICGSANTSTSGTIQITCSQIADHAQVDITIATGGTSPTLSWSLMADDGNFNGAPPVASTAVESGHVLKASPGVLYGLVVTSTVNGLVMVFNSATVPADGAVTPIYCLRLTPDSGGAGTFGINFIPGPTATFSTGISVAMSTGTNCANKTASATAWFTGMVK